MDARTRILEVTTSLLAESPDHDISTRAVCEAAGVGAPMIYRLFGDKNGLLSAVVDYGFERYLNQKRNQTPSIDPVDDLYTAWDSHVAFALENPTVYRMVYAPSLTAVPPAAEAARLLLCDRLDRCAQAGRLKVTPDIAAQTMMAACVGVTLSLLSQPETYNDRGLSARVRDAVIHGLLIDSVGRRRDSQTDPVQNAALQMAALLRRKTTTLTEPETLMMLQWLDTVRSVGEPAEPKRKRPGRTTGRTSKQPARQ